MSKLARNFQEQEAARQMEVGLLGDPLRLPFARILQETKGISMAEAYRRFVQAGAAALCLGTQEELYLDAIRGLSRHDLGVIVQAFAQLHADMERRPYRDLLGPLYMEIGHKLDKQAGGEFFTPHALSVLCGRMLMQGLEWPTDKPLQFNEPTAGTGGMVLAAAEELFNMGISPMHTQWVVQDISARSCWAAFINTTLWGIPAHIVCGNTLTLEYRWQLTNVHWHNATPRPNPEDDARFERMVTAVREFMTRQPKSPPKPSGFGPLFDEVG